MVPPAEFTTYYGRPILHTPPWGHEIPAYLFLGGVAGGSGLIAAGAAFTGREVLRRNSRIASIVAVALGGAALAKDLGRPERALNMMRTLKLTSPMSVGSWILTGFGTGAGISLAAELAPAMLPHKVATNAVVSQAISVADPIGSVTSAFFAPPLAAYTAVLLADTAAPT